MRGAATPVAFIVLGITWLLYSLDWLPDVHWIWIIGLAAAGAAILALDGITKSSIVAGPLLILASVLSYFRLYEGTGWRFIIPIMLIGAGVCMLIARSPSIPVSKVLDRRYQRRAQDDESHG